MKLKFPKYIFIGSVKMQVIADPKVYGGQFSIKEGKMIIGTKALTEGGHPEEILGTIMHEILEAWAVRLCLRTDKVNDSYQFHMSHLEYHNLIECAAKTLSEFIA